MRHVFGAFGVVAALILLGVSAAMNWQFGYSLGKTPFDSNVFGAASIAADCMKALMPFFIFAAYRNRNYPQAFGGTALWAVCIVYAMTSALGFSALNRSDTSGTRAVQAEKYEDQRGELSRVTQQQAELEKHRPLGAIQGEIDALKQNYRWTTSGGCTNATVDESRELCKTYYKLTAERDTAMKDETFQLRADELRGKIAKIQQGGVVKVADPQATIISTLSGLDIKRVEVAMTILITLLVELGSSLGLYVATSTWRIHDGPRRAAPPEPAKVVEIIRPAPVVEMRRPHLMPQLAPPAKSDIEVYVDSRIRQDDGASVTALALYDNYCDWCEAAQRQPVGLPIFSRQLTDLGVQKAKIAGKIRYIGIRIGGRVEDEDGSDLAAVS